MENVLSRLSVPSLRAAAYSSQLLTEVGRKLAAIHEAETPTMEMQIREDLIAAIQSQASAVGDIRLLDYAHEMRQINAKIAEIADSSFSTRAVWYFKQAEPFNAGILLLQREIERRARFAGFIYFLLLVIVVAYMITFIAATLTQWWS